MYTVSYVLIIAALFITLAAQIKVKNAYNKYSRVPNQRGITGAEACRRLLDANGLRDIRIERVSGTMSDHYDPKSKVIRLSTGVADQASIAAIGIAAHETGHAIQHNREYTPLKIRNVIYPVCGFGSRMAWPLFFVGILLGNSMVGVGLMNIGIFLYALAVVFYLVTLPVEFNASHRAVEQLSTCRIVNEGEISGVKSVLNSAAMTYVASALVAILQLVRMLAIRGRK